jgi:beta-xylosidase
MKSIAMIGFCVLALAACASEKGTSQLNRSSVNGTAPKTSPNTAVNTAPPANSGRTGEKVETAIEYDFKNGIPEGWQTVDPETADPSGWDTAGGVLKLRIPTGKDLFGGNLTAPRLVRNITGDFEIETRLAFSPKSDYQGAGLLLFRNDNNFLRLERGFGGVGGGADGIRFDRAEDENYEAIATTEKFPTTAASVELKMRREGGLVTSFWRETGKTTWIEVGKASNTYPATVVAGLIGVSTGEPVAAEFSYIRLTPLIKSAP